MDDLLRSLTLDDLDDEQRELADCIGLEAYKRLIVTYAGNTINVRMPDRITIGKRNDRIRREFSGYNFSELASKYGLTERHIRNIVASEIDERRCRPLENQISFFDE